MAQRSGQLTDGQMTDSELAAIIDDQIRDAVLYERSDLADIRRKALLYYQGDETLGGDVPVRDGRSRLVSRDMSDVHGWIMPSLLRVFLGGDQVVEYQPRRREAEEGAEQATDYVNYVLLTECNGYQVLHAALWDALTFGNGIVKHWWDDTPEYRTETLSGIPEIEFLELSSDPDVEILEHEAYPDQEAEDASPQLLLAPPANGANPANPANPAEADNGGQLATNLDNSPQSPPGLNFPPGSNFPPRNLPPAPISPPGMEPPDEGSDSSMMPMPGIGAGGMDLGGMGAGGMDLGPPPMLHDLKIKRCTSTGRVRVVAIPPEEFRIDRNATKLDEEHCRFAAHIRLRTRSELIEDGYPRDIVDDLPEYTQTTTNTPEAWARDQRRSGIDSAADKSTELIEVWECCALLDYDGDGVAEWRRVVAAAGVTSRSILANEEWGDDLPFSDLVPDPMPHRWRGGSLFEEVGDIQRMKTVLLRGAADNFYWINNQQLQAPKGGIDPGSLDEFFNPSFNGRIFTVGGAMVSGVEVPFIADKMMAGLEFADKIIEFRTGVSASTMSLDPEALVNQTATAVNAARTASYTKVETYAQNIAEYGGLKRIGACLLRIICGHQDKARTIRLRGEWVDIDPRTWDAEMDVIVNVGLGSGSRERDLQMLQAVAQKQEAIVQSLGPVNAAKLGISPDILLDTYRKMVKATGLKSPESYFPQTSKQDIDALMAQLAQNPEPKMLEAQARVKLLTAQSQKAQSDAAAAQTKAQSDALSAQSDNQQSMLDQQHLQAQIENLRAAAMANMAKAGAVQSDAQINAQLARLETLDRLTNLHHDQQRINQDQQRINHERQNMLERVSTPGVKP